MLEYVAVEHPVARVISDECDLAAALRLEQYRIAQSIPGQDAEHMAVQVDRVMPRGLVHELEHAGLSSLQRHERGMVRMLRGRLPVHGPVNTLVLRLLRHCAHRTADYHDPAPLPLPHAR